MAVPTPRVLEPATAAPRVGQTINNNNNNNCTPSPRVVPPTTTMTALDRLRNRLATKTVRSNARSSTLRTNSVRLKPIEEENLPHTIGTIVRKSLKKEHSVGKSAHMTRKEITTWLNTRMETQRSSDTGQWNGTSSLQIQK
jgi:hypothetical protein